MHRHSVNYLKDRDAARKRGTIVDRGFWIRGIPRPLILCRALGHKPVVDGTTRFRDESGARWVCCDRCGTRPEPQGSLDPERWNIGDPYDGPFGTDRPDYEAVKQAGTQLSAFPGLWPTKPTWVFGGQAILGRTFSRIGFSVEAKVGNCSSEHVFAAHIRVEPIGALYVHTETLGTWLQRRLNPASYESRVAGISLADGRFTWKLWAPRDGSSIGDPSWQNGSIKIDLRDKLLGRRRYWHTDEGDPVTATVRMPHGDDHDVKLQLEREEYGREKMRRRKRSWCVDWDTRDGIPTKPGGGGRIFGFGVEVSDAAVRKGTWAQEAAAVIAVKLTAMRTREGMVAAEETAV